MSRPQGHSAAGRIMSMKYYNDTIGNRTRDLTACSAVPQPTAPPPACPQSLKVVNIFLFPIQEMLLRAINVGFFQKPLIYQLPRTLFGPKIISMLCFVSSACNYYSLDCIEINPLGYLTWLHFTLLLYNLLPFTFMCSYGAINSEKQTCVA
jgi:hypothetical protein